MFNQIMSIQLYLLIKLQFKKDFIFKFLSFFSTKQKILSILMSFTSLGEKPFFEWNPPVIVVSISSEQSGFLFLKFAAL